MLRCRAIDGVWPITGQRPGATGADIARSSPITSSPADANGHPTLTLGSHRLGQSTYPLTGRSDHADGLGRPMGTLDIIGDRSHELGRNPMTNSTTWIPDDVDVSIPSVARVYDYLLGGAHNFAADRVLGDKLIAMDPSFQTATRLTRSALSRIVRHLVDSGIRQFLDLGSGIPTAANVHEIAQGLDPRCRVLYVDHDPIAAAHSELMLSGNDNAAALRADLRDVDLILGSPEATRLLNLDEPVALIFQMVLHWIPDADDPAGVVRRYRDAVCPGSYLSICHVGHGMGAARKSEVDDEIARSGTKDKIFARDHEQVLELFGDFTLVDPGLVTATAWRPDRYWNADDMTGVNQDWHTGVAIKA
ncbi:hypothetical protein D5S17_18435 [Pseudonocardiaceae bacterium YIM PH 21723]|nr:hypothetical protein D5S17_18435 [Pseudonocardiaceae bacterium YIM PH 21723]